MTSKGTPIQIDGNRPQIGDVRYIDTDDNGHITDEDKQVVGSPWAKLQTSLLFNASWKNFDFSMMWYGQFGNKIYNILTSSMRHPNYNSLIDNLKKRLDGEVFLGKK